MEKFKHDFEHKYNFGDIVEFQATKKKTRLGLIIGIVFGWIKDKYYPIYKCHSVDDQYHSDGASNELPFYFKDVKEEKIIEKMLK